jgi:hypothetical protein
MSKGSRPFDTKKSEIPSPVKKSQMDLDLSMVKERSPVAGEKVVKGSQPFDVKKSDRWKFLLSQVSLCP